MRENWQPLGTVGIITAFNFPMAVWAWNSMLALVCGDACLWKPSPKTPLVRDRHDQRHRAEVLEAEGLGAAGVGLVIGGNKDLAVGSACSTTPAPAADLVHRLVTRMGKHRGAGIAQSAAASGKDHPRVRRQQRDRRDGRRRPRSWCCPRLCSARSAPRASAARRRGASWSTRKVLERCRQDSPRARLRRTSRSATRWTRTPRAVR